MKGWKSGTIKDFGKVVTGHTPPTAQDEFWGDGYKFVTPTDLSFMNYYVQFSGSQVTEISRQKFKNKFIPPYSVSYTCIGNTIGKACLNREWVLTNQQINSIIPSEEHNHFFVYYLLNCLTEKIWGAATGAATPIINKTKFENIKIKYPPLSTQKKIAGILSAYDDAIENNLRRIMLLEEMAQITYEEWFVRLRFPGHATIPINEATGLPEGWEKEKVGNVLSKIKTTKKIQNSEFLPKGLIPIVDQSRDFIAGYTDEPEALLNMDQPLIIFGDHTRILKFINFPFARGADGTQVLLSKEPRMPQHLFYLSLIAVDLSNYHYARHFKFLKDSEIILPSKEVADEFEKYSNDKFTLIRELRNQNQHLREARDILLPRLMTGVIDAEKYQPENFLKKN